MSLALAEALPFLYFPNYTCSFERVKKITCRDDGANNLHLRVAVLLRRPACTARHAGLLCAL